ncbi:glycoside hydrolase family 36 protein [Tessaracoccus sp. ZS01]|uniref:glycoside hydrolase family 36 protein n=1 Tax=Tessaracoccus sp. ZS01 TaxID=1906324 RepID=UPI00117D8D9A|nr:glycoside hydrolase family 36 protein [Tessaracoccus sp. ZS01]MCG6567542.1 alpha-galactosidase [Tessaracoccus sp. ZS01]
MKAIRWGHDALVLEIGHGADEPVALRSAEAGGARMTTSDLVPVVQVLTSDHGHALASSRLGMSELGQALRLTDFHTDSESGRHELELDMSTTGLDVVATLESFDGVAAFTTRTTVTNTSDAPVTLLAVTSWSAPLGNRDDRPVGNTDWRLHRARSDWLAENRWDDVALGELFPRISQHLTGHRPRGQEALVSTGTWSSGEWTPVAAASSADQGVAWVWQVLHNGAWRIELGEEYRDFEVAVSGPNHMDHGWSRTLAPGESFTTVPAAVALGSDVTAAVAAVTELRRRTRRPHADNESLPVIFNDYMNTLDGDPTTAKLIPLVDAAAAAGAEIFCIDAGWYDDSGFWWDSVGAWQPSTTRFPGGLGEVVDRISGHGMVPGLWLEPEVIGVRSPLADQLPDEAFLQRGGQRLMEQGRYHLDFRHPAAVAHADAVVDRLVTDFGVGYFKFDYNINPGPGTDHASCSVGDGLLEHNRAHLAWLDSVLDRHPALVIENCGSGAMRADGALLSRLQLQSTSDQQDPLLYPPITASAPMSMLPEQAASWAYPQPGMSPEEAAFCLVTGLPGRFFLSGYLNNMTESELELVREAVALTKEIRHHIRRSTPVWPLGLPRWDDPWVTLGLDVDDATLLFIWRRADAPAAELRLPRFAGLDPRIETVFPKNLTPWQLAWSEADGVLRVDADAAPAARMIRISHKGGSDPRELA